MQQFPKFLRSENPTKFHDSPFPPFKVEHRYRGVYERAGFEVNTGSSGRNRDDRSIHSKSSGHKHHKYPTPSKSTSPTSTKSSPLSPLFNPNKGTYQTAASTPNISLQQQPFNKQRNDSLPHQAYYQDQYPQQQQPYQDKASRAYANGYPSNRNPYAQPPQSAPATSTTYPELSGHTYPEGNPSYTSRSLSNGTSGSSPPHRNVDSQVTSPSSYERDSNQHHDVTHKVPTRETVDMFPPGDDTFNFSPSSTLPLKNIKSLHLDLSKENEIDGISDSESDANPLFSKSDSFNDTKNTSVEKLDSRHNSQESTQKFDPRRRHQPHQRSASAMTNSTTSSHNRRSLAFTRRDNYPLISEEQQAPSTSAPYPAESTPEIRFSYGASPNAEPSQQFDHFRNEQNAPSQSLTTDYQKFLGGETAKINRTSQLSMVSSIISKDSMYEDEDDEVEKELERQLQTLKMAGNSSNINVQNKTETTTEPTQDYGYGNASNSVPVFNIVDADDSSQNIPTITTTGPEHKFQVDNHAEELPASMHGSVLSNGKTDSDVNDSASFGSVQPLSARHSQTAPLNKINSTQDYDIQEKELDLNDSPSLAYDDGVKPLSPKNHQVEEELKGINFRLSKANPLPQDFTVENSTPYPTENSTPYPTNDLPYPISHPRYSATSPQFQQEEFKHNPGEGPCRSCSNEVSPDGRGAERSIYSKTGELSGQWHRGCFSCEYDNCNVRFNKHVQCYAYNDKPYCNHHYHQMNDTICEHCSIGIEGECIENELGQKWHLACLRCHKCHNTIKNDYYLINGTIICENDALKIINGSEPYSDEHGNVISGGLSTRDKIEKRRTRLLFVD